MGLFRQQALNAQTRGLQGQVLLLPRVPHTLLCLGLLLWLGLALSFLFNTQYSRKETANGWLDPAEGVVRVYARSEGKLAQLLVSEGERVSRDQALAIINGDHILADGQHLESLLLHEYAEQKQALQRQLKRNNSLGLLRQQELATRLKTAHSELAWMSERIKTLEQRETLNKKRSQRHRQLASSGHITSAELEQLQEQELRLRGEIQTLTIERLQRQAQVQQVEAELAIAEHSEGNRRDQIRLQLSDLSQQIAQLRGDRAYVIKAAIDGVVSGIQLHQGQRARYNIPLLTLVPDDAELRAHLLVPIRAAGFLQPGQQLRIRYDAFPYQKFGTYHGEILQVSETPLLPGEAAEIPRPPREAVYRVTARLRRNSVSAYGAPIALKPGMTLSADIKLESRSLLHWLLEPLLSLRGRLA